MPVFLDIETASDGLYCIAHARGADPVQVDATLTPYLRSVLEDPDEVVVCHSTYDLRYLTLYHGAKVRAQLHNTMVMAWLVNENTPLDLEHLAWRYCQEKMDKRLSRSGAYFRTDDGQEVPLRMAPRQQVEAYCARDVVSMRRLYGALRHRLAAEGLTELFEQVAAPFTQVLLDMECRGMPVDLDATEALRARYTAERDRLEAALTAHLPEGFNVRSNPQVAAYLSQAKFTIKGRRPVPDKETLQALKVLEEVAGQADIDDRVEKAQPGEFVTTAFGRTWEHGVWVVAGLGLDLRESKSVSTPSLRLNPAAASHPWVQQLFEFRKYEKMLTTYVEKFPKVAIDGRIYGRFNQTGTVTGRLSSSEPNLQNIPSHGTWGDDIRDLFRGNLVVGDFSQLEPRLMAHFSQDPVLIDIFENGRDLYLETAKLVLGSDDPKSRQMMKTYVLAMGYGAGVKKLTELLRLNGFPSAQPGETARVLAKLRETYDVYFQWRAQTIATAGVSGYVTTLDGRKRRIEAFTPWHRGFTSWSGFQPWKAHTERQAANAVIQGSAADIVTRVMLHCSKMFPDLRMLAQVHDEIVWEYDPARPPDLARVETKVLGLAQRGVSVPLVFEPHFGRTWREAKDGGLKSPPGGP